MLSYCSLKLIQDDYCNSNVVLISREASKFKSKHSLTSNVIPIDFDYCKQKLDSILNKLNEYKPFDKVILWIHDSGEQFRQSLISFLLKQHNENVLIFSVMGSSSCSPIAEKDPFLENKQYKAIYLGWKKKNANNSRWLTNKEISDGVLQAIQEQNKTFIVGQIEPWCEKP